MRRTTYVLTVPPNLMQVKEQVRILEDSGQLPLAYVAAATHGLHEEAERIGQALGDDLPDLPETSQLLLPPTPILKVCQQNNYLWRVCLCACAYGKSAVLSEDTSLHRFFE